MKTLIRIAWVALLLGALASLGRAGEAPRSESEPARQWVWLASQGVWGFGYQIPEGPQSGLWRIDPGSKQAPTTADPYGFASILNEIRASRGLPPAVYDPALSSWAVENNVAQSSRGLGHHVNPNCFQNCGWNYPDAATAAQAWLNSPGHRENMLLPTMTRFGIAYGPGPYWTLNAL
jgi:uncharacterized protein YkwD